jgi:hypothetical protein
VPPISVAAPFNVQPPAAGDGTEAAVPPLPVRLTEWTPEVSLPFSTQASEAAPRTPGANRTVSVTDAPAAMVAPSGKVVIAVNPVPATGGLDLKMVRGVPPVFETVNDAVVGVPVGTVPNARVAGVTTMVGGAAADPDIGTDTVPALVTNDTSSV